MRMSSRPYWLRKPVDVQIVDLPTPAGAGFCIIKSVDYFEDSEEFDDEELARFKDVYDAFAWLSQNDYAPLDSGRADGIYRHTKAAELFYSQIDKKPVRVLKRAKERKALSPTRARILLMLSA